PAGNGCSISATPARAQATRLEPRLSSVQPSFASTISVAFGAALRTATMRSGSPSAPSFILSRDRVAAFAAAFVISAGGAREIVNAVVSAAGGRTPGDSWAGRAPRVGPPGPRAHNLE